MTGIMRTTRRCLPLCLCLAAAAAATGCGGKKSSSPAAATSTAGATAVGTDPAAAAPVPQVGAISLANLGTGKTSLALAGAADGCNQDGVGVMGIALGGACHTAPLAARILLGTDNADFNGDGTLSCADYTAAKSAGKDPGILLTLLCSTITLRNDGLTSVALEGKNGAFAIGFLPWPGDATQAVGAWSHGDPQSYPADIRIWKGPTLSSLTGLLSIALASVDSGAIQVVDLAGGGGTTPFPTSLAYSNKPAPTTCAAGVSDATCNWQEIKIYGGEGDVGGGLPNGFHLKIWADAKIDPSVIALEGAYRYTAATAAHFPASATCPGSALRGVRGIYFQVVQTGNQVWGKFAFRDAAGALLTCPVGGVDPFATLAADAGVCQNLGTNPAWVPCTDVKYTDYKALWKGETGFPAVTASPVATVFDGAPASAGLCTQAGGCRAFTSADQ